LAGIDSLFRITFSLSAGDTMVFIKGIYGKLLNISKSKNSHMGEGSDK